MYVLMLYPKDIIVNTAVKIISDAKLLGYQLTRLYSCKLEYICLEEEHPYAINNNIQHAALTMYIQ